MCDIDKAIEQYKDYQESGWSKSEVPNSYYLMLAIEALKEKQARENPLGWIDLEAEVELFNDSYACPACNTPMLGKRNYCAECGARLGGNSDV